MIAEEVGKDSLLTVQDAAGQRPVIAHDRPEPTPHVGSEDQLANPRDHEQRVSKIRGS